MSHSDSDHTELSYQATGVYQDTYQSNKFENYKSQDDHEDRDDAYREADDYHQNDREYTKSYNNKDCKGCNNKGCNACNRGCTPRYEPGMFKFCSIVTPLTDLQPQCSGCKGCVEFRMRRKNKTVTLQWEPFSGAIAMNGIAYLTVSQSVCNLPHYVLSFPIYISYLGVGRITHLEIDPHGKGGNIRIYLNTDGSSNNINFNDSITVLGGAVTWIVE